ncbi:unnamed protein product (macronuclear) [Paramecium tetraurelia]|uniref:Homeobox domain-containing protein n=1 Tax=Paramecium tetraurelia TaxID=5888 RepID=A0DQS0_PARTE|nr:uncharacterized protein GSPATT00002787001 [Paramecium tetraurelia]CAK85387.1 unnamed protein product [Paramecium tetraurelia]|eukprot:XP_001452784.1 hypothetical protein (macronuclear) [Paramecium tetraurelia strain d4-2]
MSNSSNVIGIQYNCFHKRPETKEIDLSFNFVSNNSFDNDQITRTYFSRIMSRRKGTSRFDTQESSMNIKKQIRFPTLQSKQAIQKTEIGKSMGFQIQPIQIQLKIFNAKPSESFTTEELQEQRRAYCLKQYRKYQQQRLFQQMILKNLSIKETIQTWVQSQKK